MPQVKKENNGCLQFFILGILSLVSFVIILVIFSFSAKVSFVIAILISALFLKGILGNTTFKSLFRSGIGIYIIFYGLYMVFNFLLNTNDPYSEEDITFNKEETTKKTTVIEKKDTLVLYTSNRNWIDNYGNRYTGELSVREKDYNRLKGHLNTYKATTNNNFWGHLYNYIDLKDTPSLDLVMDTFTKINQEKKLNQMEFAEMVVSCIQDIPYSFVLPIECPIDNFDATTKAILEKCPACCIGNVPFGIQNPVSFIKNLKGDCDTRTVLIYSILKHFKYDVAIANSQFYRHSILAINLPAAGNYKTLNGKKYMLWETTAKYFKIGDLPSNFNNVKYWEIVLTSK